MIPAKASVPPSGDNAKKSLWTVRSGRTMESPSAAPRPERACGGTRRSTPPRERPRRRSSRAARGAVWISRRRPRRSERSHSPIHPSSRRMSAALCQRSSGSFARHVRTTRSRAAGVAGSAAEIGAGSSFRIAAMSEAWLCRRTPSRPSPSRRAPRRRRRCRCARRPPCPRAARAPCTGTSRGSCPPA